MRSNESAVGDLLTTLEISVDMLKERRHILVFPEDSLLPMDPIYKMTPFRNGVTRLGKLYYQQTQKRLTFYPVCVHESHMVKIGDPIRYNRLNSAALERQRIKDYLETSIRDMYRQTAMEFNATVSSAEG